MADEPLLDSAFVSGLDRDNPHGQSVFASATDRSSAAAATPTAPPTCNDHWRAPRHDVPTSVDVNHVCERQLGHDGPCHCSCGKDRW